MLHRLPQATCDFEKYEVSEKVVGIHVPPAYRGGQFYTDWLPTVVS
jgi:hypothetical protein